jgi:hypothetical protein
LLCCLLPAVCCLLPAACCLLPAISTCNFYLQEEEEEEEDMHFEEAELEALRSVIENDDFSSISMLQRSGSAGTLGSDDSESNASSSSSPSSATIPTMGPTTYSSRRSIARMSAEYSQYVRETVACSMKRFSFSYVNKDSVLQFVLVETDVFMTSTIMPSLLLSGINPTPPDPAPKVARIKFAVQQLILTSKSPKATSTLQLGSQKPLVEQNSMYSVPTVSRLPSLVC